jgi:uncharacterized membrane protein YczE
MTKSKEIIKKSLVVLLGMVFMGCGINLMVYADIGADPFTTGVMGVFAAINRIGDYSFGTAQVLVNIFFVSIGFFLNRKKIGLGTLLSAFAIGVTVDLWRPILLMVLPENPDFITSLVFLLLGALVVATGIATYVSPDFGMGAGEILPIIIAEKTGWKFRYLKIGNDLFSFIVGVSLGASYGVGTIICLVSMGPIIHHLMPHMKRLYGFDE